MSIPSQRCPFIIISVRLVLNSWTNALAIKILSLLLPLLEAMSSSQVVITVSSSVFLILHIILIICIYLFGLPCGTSGKEPACQCRRHKEIQVLSLGQEDPLEEGMAIHSNILTWTIR